MNIWKLTTLVLAAILVLVVGGSNIRPVAAERQPHMVSALEHLRKARAELEAATHDKGGYRVKAIAETKKAIVLVEKGIAYDNAHRGENKK